MTEQQLPEGWQMVKFGDIAKHISKRVEPSETDLEIYVGLEHLDPDSLKIKRHGVPSDIAGQKLLVKKGQIIFGKRRAYQRKVAVADWDCICSAHAMVLEANPKNVIPEFLPFFMQSDVFMNRAVAVSEGSLSPTIKWKVLAEQNFPLPDIDNQSRLLKILNGSEMVLRELEQSLQSTRQLFTSFFEDQWNNSLDWSSCNLRDVLLGKPEYGAAAKAVPYDQGRPRYIRVTDISESGVLDQSDVVGVDSSFETKFGLNDDDFLIARSGNTVGKTLLYKKEFGHAVFAGYLIRVRLNPELVLPEFFQIFTFSSAYKSWLSGAARGGAQPNVNAKQIEDMPFKYPSIKNQKEIVELHGRIKPILISLADKDVQIKTVKKAIFRIR
ncbi:restriction endonuclease subunit S [Aestuariibacter sp. A3R04]|uniref:restriction endonuclease subunit S n=1 Tax=Aestuariibacter sp. A3R04 TaxID=2841571 RepID=UPI001C080257|nr:restriction endonuclease subunit S [Aestuariibacter sp. A3R04]MBU3020260.1 restriction endonuclease subunit S [Aestuariibacter sp. A3R04]